MAKQQKTHENHTHHHGPGCGHTGLRHGDHVDYMHGGCLHNQEGDRVTEHSIEVSDRNPDRCTPDQRCAHRSGSAHQSGSQQDMEMVPHGDHMDSVHEGRLHHDHGDHCDDHGPIEVVRQ